MEYSEDVFLSHGGIFQGSRLLRKFLLLQWSRYLSSTTMESLPLKVLDFELQRRTGPSSGVMASTI